MDKTAAWRELRFNALFHGDDWKGSDMYNEAEESCGPWRRHRVLPHTAGVSSTQLVEILQVTRGTSDDR